MYRDNTENNSGNQPGSNTDTNMANPLLNLQLNQIDRFAEWLFMLGTILGLESIDAVDAANLLKQEGRLTSEEDAASTYNIAKTFALANWIFLAGGSLIFDNSVTRLNELEKTFPENPSDADEERLTGRKMITMGATLKLLGYTLSANGFELIADSVVKETESPEIRENR